MMKTPLFKIALWIGEQMPDESVDDIYDVLLGNIRGPSQFVASVEAYHAEYNEEMERRARDCL